MRRSWLLALAVALGVAGVFVSGVERPAETQKSPSGQDVGAGPTTPAVARRARGRDEADAKTLEAPVEQVEGVVIDGDEGVPFVGAEVLVARRRTPVLPKDVLDDETPGTPEFRSTSAADGAFRVPVPDAGPWWVTARAPDRIDASRAAKPGEPVRLELRAGTDETLTVVRRIDGAPVAGAEVRVFGGREPEPPQRLRVVADGRGVARFRTSGDECVVVAAKDCVPRRLDPEQFRGEDTVELEVGYRVAGAVRDAAGQGVAGALVRADAVEGHAVLTDRDGRFSIEGVEAEGADCALEVNAEGFLSWTEDVACRVDLVVDLKRPAVVRGTVLMPDGTPAVGAEVEGATTDAAGAFRTTTTPGRSLLFADWPREHATLEGEARYEVPDGGELAGVIVRLREPERSYVAVRVVDAAGHVVTNIGPDRRQEIHGDVLVETFDTPPGRKRIVWLQDSAEPPLWWTTVEAVAQATPDGTPVEATVPTVREATLEARGADGGTLPDSVVPTIAVAAEGHDAPRLRSDRTSATFALMAGKRYSAILRAEGFATTRAELTDEQVASGRIALRLERGVTLRARLVSSDPRVADRAEATIWVGALSPSQASREPDGGREWRNVSRGVWHLGVEWPWSAAVSREVVVGDEDLDLGEILVPPSIVVRGVVRLPDGAPCGGAAVRCAFGGIERPRGRVVPSREDGSFEIEASSAPGGVLVAMKRGFGSAVVRLNSAETRPVVLDLRQEGKLDVRIRGDRRLMVIAHTIDGGAWLTTPRANTDDALGFDQRVILSGLAPGPVVVSTLGPGPRLSREVEVLPGKTVEVVLGEDR